MPPCRRAAAAAVVTIKETPRLYVVGLRSAFSVQRSFVCVCVTCCGGKGSYSALGIVSVRVSVNMALTRVRYRWKALTV